MIQISEEESKFENLDQKRTFIDHYHIILLDYFISTHRRTDFRNEVGKYERQMCVLIRVSMVKSLANQQGVWGESESMNVRYRQ